jgi:hypothetical protein
MVPFSGPRKGFVRDISPMREQSHTHGCINPQGETPGTADVMRAQALLLGHLYAAKHPITRTQHRAIVQDMVDWTLAMDAKEKLVQALAEEATETKRALTEARRRLKAAGERERRAEARRNENPAVAAMQGRAAA